MVDLSSGRGPPSTLERVLGHEGVDGVQRAGWNEVCFFGLQYFLKRYMIGAVVTKEKIEEAEKVFNVHFGDGINENTTNFYKQTL